MMCDNCDAYMPPVFDGEFNRDGSVTKQRDGALHVHVAGGYGMFIDDWEEGELDLILCHDCSVKLADLFPVVAKWADRGHPSTVSNGVDCCKYAWR